MITKQGDFPSSERAARLLGKEISNQKWLEHTFDGYKSLSFMFGEPYPSFPPFSFPSSSLRSLHGRYCASLYQAASLIFVLHPSIHLAKMHISATTVVALVAGAYAAALPAEYDPFLLSA